MNKDEIFKEADKIINKHKSKQLNKPVVSGSLLIRSLSLLEEMIDNHDAENGKIKTKNREAFSINLKYKFYEIY
jgi:hypothetical protein